MASIAIVILTFNEEKHIARAIQSIAPFASEIFVIDSYSTDRTVEIARANGAVVLQNPFVNYARQFTWGLANSPITADWIMRLDADEIIEADLAGEIISRLPKLGPEVVGVNLKRKHIFMGRWIKHGGRHPLILLRIWRRGHGRIEDRWMDEHMIVWGGKTVSFEGGFCDMNMNDLSFFIDKHNKYATREAIDVLNQRYRIFSRDVDLSSEGTSVQAAMKRFMKERVYNRVPFQISALMLFIYRYFFQLGFLDHTEGMIYHFLQGFWYRFLVGAKIRELEQTIAGIEDRDAIVAELTRATGLKIT